jgi:hypothetical protein
MILADYFRKMVAAYAAKIVTYALGFPNNRTAIKSIGVKEFGVPGIQVQNYPAAVATDLKKPFRYNLYDYSRLE